MSINREKFYNGYKGYFGNLNQSQVEAINILLDKLDNSEKFTRANEYAYVLATIKHETAETFRPIEEIGKGRSKAYGKVKANGNAYYGRGFCQLTWDFNYKKLGEILDVPLYENPDLALNPDIAYDILEYGMINGYFTGKKMSMYFTDDKTDYLHARKIINGMDRAELIASYAEKFYNIIEFTE
jgi:predicted chitinase